MLAELPFAVMDGPVAAAAGVSAAAPTAAAAATGNEKEPNEIACCRFLLQIGMGCHLCLDLRGPGSKALASTGDDPEGSAAGQQAPQDAPEPAAVQGVAADRSSHRAGACHRDHGASAAGRVRAKERAYASADRHRQRAGA